MGDIGTGLLIFYILFLTVWIMICMYTILWHQADRKRKVWMVLSYLLNVTVLIYWITWIVSPKFRNQKRYTI